MPPRPSAIAIATIGMSLVTLAAPRVAAIPPQSGLVANGTTLTATTSNAVATFARADLVGYQNVITGETYLRNPSSGELAGVDKITPTGQTLQSTNWTIGAEPGTGLPLATITLSDIGRTLVVTVKIDPDSQEIVIRSSATITSPGLRGSSWSLAGLDLSEGRVIVPARTGQVLDRSYPGIGERFEYPDVWNAQMFVYEAASGSVVCYSTDQALAFKRLRVSTRGNSTIDVAVGTDATGPYSSASSTPQVEWRLKAFRGDWQTAATVYRTWLNANRPPASTAAFPWVSNIRAVVTVIGLDTNLLAALAGVLVPSETLLYVVQWRSDGYDVDYPDYTPAAGAAAFVSQARSMGFRVMLHTDLIGVTPTNPDYASVQAFQVRHPETLQLQGWLWDKPPSNPQRFAYISPAAAAYRNLFITRVGAAVAALQPDALHLDISSATFNDGNGIIEGRSYGAASIKLHQDLRAAFPNIAFGGEGANDLLYPYDSFAQVSTYTDQPAPPARAITAFLFAPSVRYYGHLTTPIPYEPDFKWWFYDAITRASVPAYKVVTPGDVSLSNPDIARVAGILQSFQANDFQLSPGDWQGDLARWDGNGGTTASLTDQGNLLTLTAAGNTVMQMAHRANRVVTPRFIPGWPAFDASTVYGLDPDKRYWLDAVARPTTTHVSFLPPGVKVGSATSIGSTFAHVVLDSAGAASFDAAQNFLDGHTGVRYLGVDYPLGNGAVVNLTSIIAGGVSRDGIFIHPPYSGQVGGETFIEYSVPVPASALLRFGVGVADSAPCTDGVTFRVSMNGSDLWSQHVTQDGWHDVSISLAAYAGTTAALRLISNPGPANNPNCDWALWSQTRIEAGAGGGAISVPIALGPGAVFSGFTGSGLAVPGPSTVTVTNVSVPAQFTVFTSPLSAVAAGTSLTSLPFQTWLAGRDDIAQPGTIFGSGTISTGSAGGVFKNPTINAHPPSNGRTILTWTLQLPAGTPLRLNWSAGILDGGTTTDGVDFEVRINGATYWRLTTSANQWNSSSLDLAGWQGQPILVELVTDSHANNAFDWAHWADLTFTAGGGCVYTTPPGTAVAAAGGAGSFALTAGAICPWLTHSTAPWLTVSSAGSGVGNTTVQYAVAPNFGAARTGAITIGTQTFTVSQAEGSASLIQNGTFGGGLAGWATFATPDPSYIVASVNGGVLEFYRQPPPSGTNQATVFQNTGLTVPGGGGVEARFDLGNSSSARKRVSVLVLDYDFSDLSVCTFWLAPGAPLRTYRMLTHTSKPWANASIYFYAATPGSAGGAYRIDNVSLHIDPAVSGEQTQCFDATAPAPIAQADSATLLANGDFGSGLAPWGLFGQIQQQITNGVFEFYRPAGTPAGVVLQNTLLALPANEILTATFDLGNSSAVTKRVTVLLHDNDFSDLTACTFWLPPGAPLQTFAMRGFTTRAWTAATLSVYPATVGIDAWIQLDNVSLKRTPSAAIAGTECVEPAATEAGSSDPATSSAPSSAALSAPAAPAPGTPPAPPAAAPTARRRASSRRGR